MDNVCRFVDAQVVTNSIANNNPRWLAPEIIRGTPFSKASDVYPFGTILWELMTWLTPFEANGQQPNSCAIILKTALKNERPEIPENSKLLGDPCPVYDDYCKLIRRCWNQNPMRRPMFDEIASILDGFLSNLPLRTVFSESDARLPQRDDLTDISPRGSSIGRLFKYLRKNTSCLGRSRPIRKNTEYKENPDEVKTAPWMHPEEDIPGLAFEMSTPFRNERPLTPHREMQEEGGWLHLFKKQSFWCLF